MKIGTKSVLFGAHQFLIHPLFVALAWWQLYGFPWDVRLWVAFFVHDLGYIGKPNMDGEEGEEHPWLGAVIMGRLFDRTPDDPPQCPHPLCLNGWLFGETETHFIDDGECPVCRSARLAAQHWHDFTLYHSRFMARRHGREHSRLCVADKLAGCLEPDWLYLARVIATGEIVEYMSIAAHKEGGKYKNEAIAHDAGRRAWRRSVQGVSAPLGGGAPRRPRRHLDAREGGKRGRMKTLADEIIFAANQNADGVLDAQRRAGVAYTTDEASVLRAIIVSSFIAGVGTCTDALLGGVEASPVEIGKAADEAARKLGFRREV